MVQGTWNAIHSWLESHAPTVAERLAAPATEDRIADAENKLGIVFPQYFRGSLFIHDGESPDEAWLFGSHSLLPLDAIIKQHALSIQTDTSVPPDAIPKQIQPVSFDTKWIPIAYDGSGGHLILDLNPTPHGNHGQIIQTTVDGVCRFVALDFANFLDVFLARLVSGAFQLVEDALEPISESDAWWN